MTITKESGEFKQFMTFSLQTVNLNVNNVFLVEGVYRNRIAQFHRLKLKKKINI